MLIEFYSSTNTSGFPPYRKDWSAFVSQAVLLITHSIVCIYVFNLWCFSFLAVCLFSLIFYQVDLRVYKPGPMRFQVSSFLRTCLAEVAQWCSYLHIFYMADRSFAISRNFPPGQPHFASKKQELHSIKHLSLNFVYCYECILTILCLILKSYLNSIKQCPFQRRIGASLSRMVTCPNDSQLYSKKVPSKIGTSTCQQHYKRIFQLSCYIIYI